MAANDLQHGYVTLTVDKQHISGLMTTVTDPRREGVEKADEFSYSAKSIKLGSGRSCEFVVTRQLLSRERGISACAPGFRLGFYLVRPPSTFSLSAAAACAAANRAVSTRKGEQET